MIALLETDYEEGIDGRHADLRLPAVFDKGLCHRECRKQGHMQVGCTVLMYFLDRIAQEARRIQKEDAEHVCHDPALPCYVSETVVYTRRTPYS